MNSGSHAGRQRVRFGGAAEKKHQGGRARNSAPCRGSPLGACKVFARRRARQASHVGRDTGRRGARGPMGSGHGKTMIIAELEGAGNSMRRPKGFRTFLSSKGRGRLPLVRADGWRDKTPRAGENLTVLRNAGGPRGWTISPGRWGEGFGTRRPEIFSGSVEQDPAIGGVVRSAGAEGTRHHRGPEGCVEGPAPSSSFTCMVGRRT